jgi:O-antigen ligase
VTLTAAALLAPLPTAVLIALAALFALLCRVPEAAVLILIVFMGNVKFNYYAGFFTFLPEYIVFVLASLILLLRWMEDRRPLEERGILLLLAAWIFAGVLSCVYAELLGKVFAKAVLIGLAAMTCCLTFVGVRTERQLGRALVWWEGAAMVSVLYGIVQMAGIMMGFDTSLHFLEKYGNPLMYYGIGSPAELNFSWFFRVNAFFNDPNILAGYLAAAISMTLALLLRHAGVAERRTRARFESLLLWLGMICMLFTLSRSGVLALFAGCATVLIFEPEVLRRGRFWFMAAVGLAGAGLVSAAMGIDPLLLVERLAQSFDENDISSRLHHGVFLYGLSLLARYPLTGVGLGNFGVHYGSEVNVYYPNMMAHNAPLSYFAESGLLGGCAFLAVLGVILWRPWRALQSPSLRRERPELRACLVGLLGALVAINVSNLFYDYYLRTFIWVVSGLALVAARLAEHPGVSGGSTSGDIATPARAGR